jgi:hypothetical protein
VPAAAAYTMVANPTSLAIMAGAAANTMLTVTPTGGYRGTVTLSCSNLPANASCTFAQNQVTLNGNNQSVNMGLTIQTTKQQARELAPQTPLTPALLALAFWWPSGLTGVAVFARRRKLVRPARVWQLCLLILCTGVLAAGLSGCGMSGYEWHSTTTTSQVTIVATATSGNAVTTQNVLLTLKMTQ